MSKHNQAFTSLVIFSSLVSFLLLGTVAALADEDQNTVILEVEGPVTGQTYSGVANIRGWALSDKTIDRVELYINGIYRTNIPIGGTRKDVGKKYPGKPNAVTSGFSMAYSFNNLNPGDHTISILAVDKEGYSKLAKVPFKTVRFHLRHLQDEKAVSFKDANFELAEQSIKVVGMDFDGKGYNVELNWRPESQSFQFSAIDGR
jgi:hypothetical protein